MGVEVDFYNFGWLYLAPGQEATWFFEWIFDQDHWARISAFPSDQGPNGSTVQIEAEWMAKNQLLVLFKNNGGPDWVAFQPTVIVAPSRS